MGTLGENLLDHVTTSSTTRSRGGGEKTSIALCQLAHSLLLSRALVPSCCSPSVERYMMMVELTWQLEELIESVHSRSLETQFRSLFDNLFQTVLRPNLGIYTQEAMSLHEDELSAEEQTAKETLERCLNVVASTVDL